MKCNVSLQKTTSSPQSYQNNTTEKWQFDQDKLTFIILARGSTQLPSQIFPEDPRLAILPMVGDVNIFLHGTSEHDPDFEAEVEIMIAGMLSVRFYLVRIYLLINSFRTIFSA